MCSTGVCPGSNRALGLCAEKMRCASERLQWYIYIYMYIYIYIYDVCIYIYYVYIYILCIYILCIYIYYVYIYILCIYTMCIYIYILCIYTMCIYIYMMYIYIYDVYIYIWYVYIYIYIWYIYIGFIYIYIWYIRIHITCVHIYIYIIVYAESHPSVDRIWNFSKPKHQICIYIYTEQYSIYSRLTLYQQIQYRSLEIRVKSLYNPWDSQKKAPGPGSRFQFTNVVTVQGFSRPVGRSSLEKGWPIRIEPFL